MITKEYDKKQNMKFVIHIELVNGSKKSAKLRNDFEKIILEKLLKVKNIINK